MLRASNLAKVYGRGPRRVEAVSGADLEVDRGQFLAVTGRSGSGKSTLLGMIGGLSWPTRGTVTLDGVELWSLPDAARADFRCRRIGFVFQFASLLPSLRAVDNVALPALVGRTLGAEAAYKRAEHLLARVGLAERLGAYPGELSGGEQRRVALARALINSPGLLLADEPTGDLDEDTEAEILDLLRDVQRTDRITLVVVTHNGALARGADRVIRVRQGRLAAVGLSENGLVPSVLREEGSGHRKDKPDRPLPASHPAAVAEEKSGPPERPAVAAPPPGPLGEGLGAFAARFAAWAVLTALLLLGVNQALSLHQRGQIDEQQRARLELEELAMSGLRADIDDLAQGTGGTYQLTLYLWNVSGGKPLYVMAPSVRAYVQVGSVWQEVPLRPADGREGRVLRVSGRQKHRYVLRPAVRRFEELLPGYMHVRFTNALLVSLEPEPAGGLVERVDNYYVYLKPHGADDAAILRKMKFPGKPPVWIPMPPH
jgi:putative ABC transport system ATP-binding protein/macrolide transport system ATP-binding/permease protein/lipoprotein-releasing system ATP-binding protein